MPKMPTPPVLRLRPIGPILHPDEWEQVAALQGHQYTLNEGPVETYEPPRIPLLYEGDQA